MTLRNAGTANDYTHIFNVENELVSVVNNGSTTTFAYDASGIRVKAVAPNNGTVTDYPFPGYEVESPTSNPTVCLTFSIAGQAVALKVMGSSSATYYLYNDHLGSTSTMSITSGGTVSVSTSRYYPFGDWRTEPTANLTDPTGHRECEFDDHCLPGFSHPPHNHPSIQEQVRQGSNVYGSVFTADDGKAWTNEQMVAVLSGARLC
ncbi:MAG: hypothetical protein HND44_21130 [Chloroflexi bacterium]|nr:hypothetical protein [Ardenticatenaceae bacterium]MBL1130949.1 hypothetical protein [Chloroflexota bacterium]NOG37046.1 hypothetical protein [Chloroflexota bacterium]